MRLPLLLPPTLPRSSKFREWETVREGDNEDKEMLLCFAETAKRVLAARAATAGINVSVGSSG